MVFKRIISPLLKNGKRLGEIPIRHASSELENFKAVFPVVIKDLESLTSQGGIPEATKWFTEMTKYNVLGGKYNRGMTVVDSYRILTDNAHTEESYLRAQVAGWLVEMLQGRFLIEDDIMDDSETRRGKACWYRTNNLGAKAINDGIYLDSAIYSLLGKYFRSHKCYTEMMEIFHETTLKTAIGQHLDISCLTMDNRPRIELFTMDRYKAIVEYKTAYYSFQLPVALAFYMAGITDEEAHRQTKEILLEMGHYFQVQDDFLDAFADPEVTGKIGTDIIDGKCSWLVVAALQRANQHQRKFIQDSYGTSEFEEEIQNLYIELKLPEAYRKYEEEFNDSISKKISRITSSNSKSLLSNLLAKIYKRLS